MIESQIKSLLSQRNTLLILAESCTGGLATARLVSQPGISQWLSGAFVTYRPETKRRWLGVHLKKHSIVSRHVALAMARGALKKSPESGLAVAITGRLDTDKTSGPASQSGICWLAAATRKRAITKKIRLKKGSRVQRQRLASQAVLEMVRFVLLSKGWRI